MILKALDLLRTLGWGIVNFIFSLIDSLFDIIRELNSFDIIDSLANNQIFKNLHSGIIAIALTLFGLVVIWKFVSKVIDPDEGPSISMIVKEVFKCGFLVLLSTFLFSQVSTFSIKLSGYAGSIFSSNNTSLSNSMLQLYVDYSDGYKSSNPEYNKEAIPILLKNKTFTTAKLYNSKYVTDDHWILPDEKDYVYSINWIMAILIGGFFLYALFFSGMMLGRRQIEFLFLFLISPIIFATSVNNKQRRNALFEQLVSLVLQASVVLLIINITALVMQAVNNTTFFTSPLKDIIIKSIMFIGCGSFLLTGSQVINRFIGGNVSANSGRETMMSLMGFGQSMGSMASIGGGLLAGGGMLATGGIAKGLAHSGAGTKAKASIGGMISNFGSKISNNTGITNANNPLNKIGQSISNFGNKMESSAKKKLDFSNPSSISSYKRNNMFNNIGDSLIRNGTNNIQNAIGTAIPTNSAYRRRYMYRN